MGYIISAVVSFFLIPEIRCTNHICIVKRKGVLKEKMGTVSRKSKENNENVEFLNSVIKDYDANMDGNLELISELRHIIREREFEQEQLEKKRMSNVGMFSPNEVSSLDGFGTSYSESIEELKEKLYAMEKQYDDYKVKKDKLVELRDEVKTLLKKQTKTNSVPDNNFGMKLLEIQELERNRIAGELHDSAVQNLTGLVHKSELCVKLFDIDETRARLELSSIIDVAKEAIIEIREAIFDLRPIAMDDFGLADAIDNFINSINKEHKIAFIIYKEGDEYNLEEIVEINLYRIAQEACNNIMKHSKASKASVLLRFEPETLLMTVTDDGIGIPENKIKESKYAKKNFGISIMRERAGVLNGSFEILNRPQGGTEIRVSVPIQRK